MSQSTVGRPEIEAARLLLERMNITVADLSADLLGQSLDHEGVGSESRRAPHCWQMRCQ